MNLFKHQSQLCLIAVLLTLGWNGVATAVVDPANDEPSVKSGPYTHFLDQYCFRCHGEGVQKADRRFDQLETIETSQRGELLQEVVDQLNLGAMPPEGEKQPGPDEVAGVIAGLTEELKRAREAEKNANAKVVMRRLNRSEYRNTVRDLFQLPMVDFDPTKLFPADDSTEGFDTVGEGLATSDQHLERYLEAARQVADKVIRPGPKPVVYRESLRGEEIGGARPGFGGEVARLFIKFRQPLGLTRLDKRRGVAEDGEYVIRFRARAHQRRSRYSDQDLRYDSNQPMRLSISVDSRELGPTAHRIIGEYEIPDDQWVDVEHRVWLERGFTFHLHWSNGPDGSFKRIMRKVLPKYNDEAIYPLRNPPEMYIGSGPELQVQSVELEGPFYPEWPPAGFARYFPNPPVTPGADYLKSCLARVADRAWRRPVKRQELEPHLDLALAHFDRTGDCWEAARFGLRSILTSPHFIFRAETVDVGSPGPEKHVITDHDFATRLSYFLWSSLPDAELRKLADRGRLSEPEVLHQQVVRMLDDPRSKALAENFCDQWLQLRQLGEMPPDPEKNKRYYQDNLQLAMMTETRLFFRNLLDHNLSILDFVDSNYTFANAALARHYQIRLPEGQGFAKVALEPKDRRGGLLGQGSILTATSNGVETQPVRRGVWVLENLLGTPPNQPPPDIEPIEPDTRGVATIRQLMDKHRQNPTCYECHRKIDPLGLSLEHFDHIGAWRDRYAKHLPIDSSGKLPDGTAIGGADDLRRYLVTRPEQFTRCLTEKLLVYGLGRRMTFADRQDIDEIVAAMPEKGYGFRDLIQMIVASEAFHSK